jgi:hypothetical protein
MKKFFGLAVALVLVAVPPSFAQDGPDLDDLLKRIFNAKEYQPMDVDDRRTFHPISGDGPEVVEVIETRIEGPRNEGFIDRSGARDRKAPERGEPGGGVATKPVVRKTSNGCTILKEVPLSPITWEVTVELNGKTSTHKGGDKDQAGRTACGFLQAG